MNHTSSSAACDDFWSATPLSPAAQCPALALDPGSDVVGCLGLSNAYAVRCLPSPVLSKLWLVLTLEPLTLLCACLVYPLFLSQASATVPWDRDVLIVPPHFFKGVGSDYDNVVQPFKSI